MSTRRERDKRKDLLQGTLDLLVLRTLSTGGTLHGYAIAERKRLAEEEEHWTRLTGAVGRVLREA